MRVRRVARALQRPRLDSCLAHFLIIYLTALVYVAMYLITPYISNSAYYDERYYISAGIMYVKGAPLTKYNPEHPPLGKYLIGLSAVYLHNPHIVVFIAGLISTLLIYFIVLRITGNVISSFLAVVLISLEVPFIKIFRYALLDSVAMPFLLGAFYLTIRNIQTNNLSYSRITAEGVLWGLATACKWPSLYFLISAILTGFILHSCKKTRAPFKSKFYTIAALRGVVLVSVALATYSLTFLRDFIQSPILFVRHTEFMITYMYRVHSIILNTVIQSLTMLFFKTTFWHILPTIHVFVNISKGVIVSTLTKVYRPRHAIEVDMQPSFGALLMPLISVLLPYGALIYRKLSILQRTAFIFAVTSLLPIFHGSIPWYFVYPITFWGIFFSTIAKPKILAVLIFADIIYYAIICSLGINHLIVIQAN